MHLAHAGLRKRFNFLHPPRGDAPARRNDHSCVLRIEASGASMLLTGDIEDSAEAQLSEAGLLSQTDVLLVPHHGSRSSSSAEFIAALAPRWAIASAGYRSRFGHPAPQVLERYRAGGARLLRTDRDGAIAVRLGPGGVAVQAERRRRARYWLQ